MIRIFLSLLMCAAVTRVGAGPLDTWQVRTNFISQVLPDVAHHNGVYVFTAWDPNRIITTTNLNMPDSFAFHTVSNGRPRSVEYGAGRFVVACEGGSMLSSTNGYEWGSHGASGAYLSMIFAGNRFVAIGNRLATSSTNGTDWIPGQLPVSAQDLTFGNGIFLATGNVTNAISTDGITWETYVLPGRTNFYTVGFGEGKFVGIAITSTGPNIFISTDGRNWETHGRLEVVRPGRIAWGNGYFVTVGGGARAYSDNGISWTVVPSNRTESNVEFIGGRFMVPSYQTLAESGPVAQLVWRPGSQIEISVAPGQRLRLEGAESITSDWQAVEPEIVATGDNMKLEVPTAGAQKFFRARLLE